MDQVAVLIVKIYVMNRVILIGNGFDLFHGLKTSYKHFIDNYWQNVINKINKEVTKNVHNEWENDDFKILNQRENNFLHSFNAKDFKRFKALLDVQNIKIEFHNEFLNILSKNSSLENWSGIESEYYNQLKELLKGERSNSKFRDINDLNRCFLRIKDLLKQYIKDVEEPYKVKGAVCNDALFSEFYKEYDMEDFEESYIKLRVESELKNFENLYSRYSHNYGQFIRSNFNDFESNSDNHKLSLAANFFDSNNGIFDNSTVRETLFNKELSSKCFNLVPDSILFLSFNYTDIFLDYSKYKDGPRYNKLNINIGINKIHGDYLDSTNDPLIFGFGDELDQDYHEIERVNDNRYLENIKSIKYLESRNYKKLIEFIGSDYFQVFVVGHSCGLSDRTLLSTIFEHQNCASIKVFYYENGESDNYSDIIRNISRSFRDKMKMRERVVNKSNSQPLPKA